MFYSAVENYWILVGGMRGSVESTVGCAFMLSSCPVCQNGTPSNVPRYRNDELDDKKDATS